MTRIAPRKATHIAVRILDLRGQNSWKHVSRHRPRDQAFVATAYQFGVTSEAAAEADRCDPTLPTELPVTT